MECDLKHVMDSRKASDPTSPNLTSLEVKGIMYQIIDGVTYCHEHRVMHRDLKPQNILLNATGVFLTFRTVLLWENANCLCQHFLSFRYLCSHPTFFIGISSWNTSARLFTFPFEILRFVVGSNYWIPNPMHFDVLWNSLFSQFDVLMCRVDS